MLHFILISLNSYVYSNLVGKCRRKAILEYFQEQESGDALTFGQCCDVCEADLTTEDHQEKLTVLLTAIEELNGFGEKKVS